MENLTTGVFLVGTRSSRLKGPAVKRPEPKQPPRAQLRQKQLARIALLRDPVQTVSAKREALAEVMYQCEIALPVDLLAAVRSLEGHAELGLLARQVAETIQQQMRDMIRLV